MENMLWIMIEGRVSKVLSSNTILLALRHSHRTMRVNLAGIGRIPTASAGGTPNNFLVDLLINKKVKVLVNPSIWDPLPPSKRPKEISGAVHCDANLPDSDIGLLLLERGLVAFSEPQAYTMSSYTSCQYRRAEADARSKALGLWRKPG